MKFYQPASSAAKIAIGVEGLGFESRVGQIGHSVAKDSPPLRCFFGAVVLHRRQVAEMSPATSSRFGVIPHLIYIFQMKI